MNDIFLQALRLAHNGVAVVPVAQDGTKRPAIYSWKKYQEQLPTPEELTEWFGKGTQSGLGAICGAVSGNLEMLELEGRAVAADLLTQAKEMAINSGFGDLWQKIQDGYCETTPSGGIHWLYKISDAKVPGNTHLARRPGENGGIDVLCETRGEGGFVILAPSAGTCHPSGRAWSMISGSIETIPTITFAEREQLHLLFQCFDEMPTVESIANQLSSKEPNLALPGDDYNSKVSWDQILTPLGWSKVYSKGDQIAWRRPNKTEGISATTNFNGKDNLYVFSTSTIFEANHSYSKFAAFACLEHNNDYKKAAAALRAQGYGASSEIKPLATLAAHSPSLVTLRDENEEQSTSSWIPEFINADEIVDEPKPNILARADGESVFYSGKINALFGESESGKTWVALEAVRQELDQGNNVFYLDFEDSKRGIYNRLQTLNVPLNAFKVFQYANPTEALEPGVREALLGHIAEFLPTLIVVDGVNAAMNMLGLDLEKNKDATAFSQEVLRPLRIHGAGIITIDHVTKSKDNRGNYAIGAQAKRADIDGCAIAVDVVTPFGRGIDGCLALKVTKDRPGYVRAICQNGSELGQAIIKALPDGKLKITIEGATTQISSHDKNMEKVSNYLESYGGELGLNEIKIGLRNEQAGMGSDGVRIALVSLTQRGYVEMQKQGQKSLYKHRQGYVAAFVNSLDLQNDQ